MPDHPWRSPWRTAPGARPPVATCWGRTSTPANDQTYSGKWITDLSLSYRLWDQLTVRGGADNLFNIYPDRTIAANSSGGIFLYSGLSPFGYDGAFYYLRLSVGM